MALTPGVFLVGASLTANQDRSVVASGLRVGLCRFGCHRESIFPVGVLSDHRVALAGACENPAKFVP